MYVVTTAEIRWFYKGEIPADFLKWFGGFNGLFEEQGVRTDLYLKMNENTNYGIKLREGKFEVKKITANKGILSANHVEGIADTWIKWSLKADEQEEIDMAFRDSAHWIEVEKKRMMQKFIPDDKGHLIPHPTEFFPPKGISVELSRIFHNKEKFWTFGMEAFGHDNEIVDLLQSCFRHFFAKRPPTALSLDHSFSYPEWLRYLSNQE